MKRILFILFLLLVSTAASAQTGWQFTDPSVKGKITFTNGYQLYDSSGSGLKLTGNLFLTGTKIILGANMEIRDSAGYSIFNRTPIFRNAVPWISAGDIKDTSLPISKIKKGQITADLFTPTLKDSIFGNTSVGDISRTLNDVKTRYNLLFDAKGDFKPSVFPNSGSILTYDTTTNKIKFDSTKLVASSEVATFFKYADTVNFLSVTDINDSLFKINGGKLSIKPGSINPSKLDSSKFASNLGIDNTGKLTIKPGSIKATDLDSSKFTSGLKLTDGRLDLNIPGTFKDTLGVYLQKETIFLTWVDTCTHNGTDWMPVRMGYSPGSSDTIGYVLPRKARVKSVTVITAAGVRKKVLENPATPYYIDANTGITICVFKANDGGFPTTTYYPSIGISENGILDFNFFEYIVESIQQFKVTFTTGINKVIMELQLEPL